MNYACIVSSSALSDHRFIVLCADLLDPQAVGAGLLQRMCRDDCSSPVWPVGVCLPARPASADWPLTAAH